MKVDAYDYVDEVEGCFALDGFENQLVVLFFMSRLREMPLRLRHDQALIHPVIEFSLHPAVEAHGVVLADPLGR